MESVMTLDTKNNNQPPFVFTQTSVGFLRKRDSDLFEHQKPKKAFKDRQLSVGIERDFVNENIDKI